MAMFVQDMMTTISEAEYNKEGGDSDNSAGDQETIGMIKVTGNNVSLRYQPSTSANRVGTANIGDCFYYVDTVDGWFQTRSGYWISRSYAAVMTDEEVKAYIKNNGGSGNTGSSYTLGSTGSTVSYIQTALTALEYYDRQITGHYGRYTKRRGARVPARQQPDGGWRLRRGDACGDSEGIFRFEQRDHDVQRYVL